MYTKCLKLCLTLAKIHYYHLKLIVECLTSHDVDGKENLPATWEEARLKNGKRVT